MQLLYLLESIRIPGLNEFMLLVTKLGEETAFLVAALIIFWCVDKGRGYYVMTVGFLGTMANQFLKLWFRVPRPWVLDENFTILESAREAASGYSFPSGHSQSAVGTFGAIANSAKNKWVKGICIAVCVLVPLSRMYIGVHTPSDVLVGAGMACALVWLLKKPVLERSDKAMKVLIAVMLGCALGLLLFVEGYPFPADVDEHNLQSGIKNAHTMIGCITGVAVVYVFEKKYVNFETKAIWWAQLLKVALGLALVLGVKEGLRNPLDALFAGHMAARAVRYFLIVLAAGGLWPMTFRWFSGLGVKK
ncbi:MAG: phosphatase PAP2 family protein [Oscillospiraceae bacterium]|nr:phosphatase PAP2 family protein [Oscillospiraceae bacterium]